MDIKKSYILTSAIIAIVLLIIAIPTGLPYGYYTFLRWAITAAALYIAWASYELKKMPWTWILGLTAVLFNPIIPIYLNKDSWVLIDIVAIVIFITTFFIKSRDHSHNSDETQITLPKSVTKFQSIEKNRNMIMIFLLIASIVIVLIYLA